MAITFKSLGKVLKSITDSRIPVLIRGRHGIGKSEIVYQYAEENGLEVIERRASQMTEGDLLGLPVLDGNTTSWNPPDWYKYACENPVLLFLDELDRATMEVRQGVFELSGSRKMNGHHLHEGTLVFAAVNGGEHGAQYQVGDFDPAELDRWCCFDVEPTIQDWQKWGAKVVEGKPNVNPIIRDFISHNKRHLEHKEDFEPNKVYPSRRSWKRLNDILEGAGLFTKYESSPILYNIALGMVGMEAATAFNDYCDKYVNVLKVSDIITKGKTPQGWGVNDFTDMVDKFKTSSILKRDLTDKEAENVRNYIAMNPSELVMALIGVFANSKESNVLKIYGGKTKEGIAFPDFLNKTLTANKE